MSEEKEMVTITKAEYDSLREDAVKLACMESCGVDNWVGYDGAMENFRNSQE